MDAFYFYNPVKIHFGEGSIRALKDEMKPYKKVLLTYGKGSIKKNGIYDKVMEALEGKEVYELSDIMPNPRVEKVYEGIKLVKNHDIDFILAVGGGSTIDCSKAIAAGAKTDEDFWKKYFIDKDDVLDATPLGSVLTMAGTGSEMDNGGVITNWQEQKKLSFGGEPCYPKFSILDPTYTYSLPKHHLISGTVDMFSHIMEEYFSMPDEENTTDEISEALMRTVIENIYIALEDPRNYRARANLMWASTLAINGLTSLGKRSDWLSHRLEHTLSAFYDVSHGMGLAVMHPNYLKYVYKGHEKKFRRWAENVWKMDTSNMTDDEAAIKSIEKLQDFFKSIGAPTTLKELDITRDSIEAMAKKTDVYKTSYSDLKLEDIINIYEQAYE